MHRDALEGLDDQGLESEHPGHRQALEPALDVAGRRAERPIAPRRATVPRVRRPPPHARPALHRRRRSPRAHTTTTSPASSVRVRTPGSTRLAACSSRYARCVRATWASATMRGVALGEVAALTAAVRASREPVSSPACTSRIIPLNTMCAERSAIRRWPSARHVAKSPTSRAIRPRTSSDHEARYSLPHVAITVSSSNTERASSGSRSARCSAAVTAVSASRYSSPLALASSRMAALRLDVGPLDPASRSHRERITQPVRYLARCGAPARRSPRHLVRTRSAPTSPPRRPATRPARRPRCAR